MSLDELRSFLITDVLKVRLSGEDELLGSKADETGLSDFDKLVEGQGLNIYPV